MELDYWVILTHIFLYKWYDLGKRHNTLFYTLKTNQLNTGLCVFLYPISFIDKKCVSEAIPHSKVPTVEGILINCKLGVRNQVGPVKATGFGYSKIIDRQYKYNESLTRRHETATLLELE